MSAARNALLLLAAAVGFSFLPSRHPIPDDGMVPSTSADGSTGKIRVGLVFDVGGRGDKSFNDSAYRGLSRAEQELGVEVAYLEPTGSGDREAALRRFAASGYDLVIGVGFLFSSDVDAVARTFPNVHFACVDYFPGPAGIPPNVAGLSFREEQGSFLVGAVAASISKAHDVGFVGGMRGPLIAKFEAGYRAGAKAVCPSCEVRVTYIGSSPDAYKDPTKGKALALSEIAEGADVIYQAAGASGHGVFEAAKDSQVLAIGVDSDQHDDAPAGVIVTSMVKRVDVAVESIVRDEKEKRFVGGMRVLGIAEHGVDYVHEGPHADGIPQDVRIKVDALAAQIARGEISVPAK